MYILNIRSDTFGRPSIHRRRRRRRHRRRPTHEHLI